MNKQHNESLPAIMADFISRHSLLRPGAGVIVALSGGADSVALLAALCSCGYNCIGAHCNFHLRGVESMRDAAHAASICKRLGCDFTTRDFDVPARMKLHGESVEMACRALRYEWFDSLLEREHAQAIAVGHHREDNVETFLLNLLRGTGAQGLCGMRPRNGFVIRPLLECSRRQIEEYLQETGLDFVTDSSNASNDFRRNRLRNIVVPMIDSQFEGASEAILRTMSNISDSHRLYLRLVEEKATEYRRNGDILLSRMAENEPDARMLLFEMLNRSEGFNMSAVSDMLRNPGGSGLRFVSNTGNVWELNRGVLSPIRTQGAWINNESYVLNLNRDILSPLHIRVRRHHVCEFKPLRNPAMLYLDASLLDDPEPCVLRHWHRGDRLDPFGMCGSRLVSDIFSEAHLSAADKRAAWLLCHGDRILWVCGIRASRHFTVGPGTKEYLQLELEQK